MALFLAAFGVVLTRRGAVEHQFDRIVSWRAVVEEVEHLKKAHKEFLDAHATVGIFDIDARSRALF